MKNAFLQHCAASVARTLRFFVRSPRLIVLTYHDVGDADTSLSVPTEEFAAHLAYLKERHIRVLLLDEFERIVNGTERLAANSALITFDDGYRGVYTHALPLLRSYGFPAVVFATPAYAGKAAAFASTARDRERLLMGEEELRECASSDIAVANHGWSHIPLDSLRDAERRAEYTRAAGWLAEHIPGAHADVFAYPKGRDEGTAAVLRSVGARRLFSGGETAVPANAEETIPRVTMYPGTSVERLSNTLNPLFLFIRKYHRFIGITAALLLLKVVLSILLLSGIPDIGMGEYFFVPDSGDGVSAVRAAAGLLSGDIDFTQLIGFPVFLAFLMRIFGVTTLPEFAAPFVLVNVFLIGSLSLLVVMLIVKRVFTREAWSDWFAAFAGGVFIALPYVWFFLFKDFSLTTTLGTTDPIGMTRTHQLFGLSILSDHLSALLVYAGFFMLVGPRMPRNLVATGWGALFFGLSVLVRLQNIVLAAALPVVLLFARRARHAAVALLTLILVALPQMTHNFIVTGSPLFSADYDPSFNAGLSESTFGIANLLSVPARIVRYAPAWLVLGAFLLLALVLFGAYRYFKRDRYMSLLLLFGAILAPVSLFVFDSTVRNPRYFLPFIPLFFVLCVGAACFAWERYVPDRYKQTLRERGAEFFKYGVMSIFTYSFIFGGQYVLTDLAGLPANISYAIVITLSYVILYFSSVGFIFKTASTRHTKVRFIFHVGIFWLLNIVAFNIIFANTNIYHLLITAINLVVFSVVRFASLRYFVFRSPAELSAARR